MLKWKAMIYFGVDRLERYIHYFVFFFDFDNLRFDYIEPKFTILSVYLFFFMNVLFWLCLHVYVSIFSTET